MLKVSISIVIATIAGTFILAESGIIDALLTFLLSGGIPGTSFTISPNLMMLGIAATAWLIIFHATAQGAFHMLRVRRLVSHYEKRKSHMPRRRFGLIPMNLDR